MVSNVEVVTYSKLDEGEKPDTIAVPRLTLFYRCGKAIPAESPAKGIARRGICADNTEVPIMGKEAGIGDGGHLRLSSSYRQVLRLGEGREQPERNATRCTVGRTDGRNRF